MSELMALNEFMKLFYAPAVFLTKTSIKIVNVKFNDPATIVWWSDGSKTVVKTQDGELFDKEKGLAMAVIKRLSGNTGKYNTIFTKWCYTDNEV